MPTPRHRWSLIHKRLPCIARWLCSRPPSLFARTVHYSAPSAVVYSTFSTPHLRGSRPSNVRRALYVDYVILMHDAPGHNISMLCPGACNKCVLFHCIDTCGDAESARDMYKDRSRLLNLWTRVYLMWHTNAALVYTNHSLYSHQRAAVMATRFFVSVIYQSARHVDKHSNTLSVRGASTTTHTQETANRIRWRGDFHLINKVINRNMLGPSSTFFGHQEFVWRAANHLRVRLMLRSRTSRAHAVKCFALERTMLMCIYI